MRILTICPSIRPVLFKTMAESFKNTVREKNHLHMISEGTVTEAINSIMPIVDDYDFVHITNDDVIYSTYGWDSILCKDGKISYGNDKYQGEFMPTFPVIPVNIIKALGWAQLPYLNRYCGDLVWKHIGEKLNILSYNPDVIIEHKWDEQVTPSLYAKDLMEYKKWCFTQSIIDIAKVKNVL